jgi:hypothetical protein
MQYLQKRGAGKSPVIHIRIAPRTLRSLEAKATEFNTTVSGVARDILDVMMDCISYADTLPAAANQEQVRRIAARIERHAAGRERDVKNG